MSTRHLLEHRALVGAQVHNAVADDHVRPPVVHGNGLGEALADLDVRQAHAARPLSGLRSHLRRHVHRDDPTIRSNLLRRDERIESCPAADIDHTLAGCKVAEEERVACAGKRTHIRGREPVDDLARIAEHLSQWASRVEVEAKLGVRRDLGVLFGDESPQLSSVNVGHANRLSAHVPTPIECWWDTARRIRE